MYLNFSFFGVGAKQSLQNNKKKRNRLMTEKKYHSICNRQECFRLTFIYSIFMFAAFSVIFVFAPLVLFFGSLVFHCPRSFVLRVRVFLHIVYLASL